MLEVCNHILYAPCMLYAPLIKGGAYIQVTGCKDIQVLYRAYRYTGCFSSKGISYFVKPSFGMPAYWQNE
jgi:hypothetical protein